MKMMWKYGLALVTGLALGGALIVAMESGRGERESGPARETKVSPAGLLLVKTSGITPACLREDRLQEAIDRLTGRDFAYFDRVADCALLPRGVEAELVRARVFAPNLIQVRGGEEIVQVWVPSHLIDLVYVEVEELAGAE